MLNSIYAHCIVFTYFILIFIFFSFSVSQFFMNLQYALPILHLLIFYYISCYNILLFFL